MQDVRILQDCKNFAGTFTVLPETLENHRNWCRLYALKSIFYFFLFRNGYESRSISDYFVCILLHSAMSLECQALCRVSSRAVTQVLSIQMSGWQSSGRALVTDRIDASFCNWRSGKPAREGEIQNWSGRARVRGRKPATAENQRVRKIASEKNQSLSRARRDRDGGLAGLGTRVGISPVLYIFTTVFCLAKEMCKLP